MKNKKVKKIIQNILNLFNFFGIDLFKLILSILFIPKFLKNFFFYFKNGGKINKFSPIFIDFYETNIMSGHYFHQDLLVANKIFLSNPKRHVDIGSRVDGFVAHVASFRKIEIFDLRQIGISKHHNISFTRYDLLKPSLIEKSDSVSCLHTLEHVGLGRYGDDIYPLGHIKAFDNLLSLLDINGILYLSFPINSTVTKVEFNKQRIFFYKEIFKWLDKYSGKFTLLQFDYINDEDEIIIDHNLNNDISHLEYGCGIYTLIRNE